MSISKLFYTIYFTILVIPCNIAGNLLNNLKFNQFSTFNGLPNNMVHQVYQDRDGYIWIATFYGLFQYDGYEVTSVRKIVIVLFFACIKNVIFLISIFGLFF